MMGGALNLKGRNNKGAIDCMEGVTHGRSKGIFEKVG